MYAVFPELCNQLYVGYWKCPGLNDSSLLANSWLLLTPLSYFPYWIWQIFSIFQPKLILLQIIPEIRWKKNQISIIFVIVFWFTTTNSNGNHKAMKKNPTYPPKWNKKRVLFCSNNINKSQSFQFSQVLLTEPSSLHDSTAEIFSTCIEGQICWRLSYWHLWSHSKKG